MTADRRERSRLRQWFTRPRRLISWAAFAAFLVLMVVAQVYHEPWRDELHCWMVGRNATGLVDVLFGDRRYDGHPFLWYWLLHLVSLVSRRPEALQVFTVLCSAATGYLVLFRSPFAIYERVLLLLSYYFVYEYAVIGRSYVLGVLLVCAFGASYDPRRVRHVALSLLLVLMAAVSAYHAIIAGALAFFLLLHHGAVGPTPLRRSFVSIAVPRAAFAGLLLFVLGLLFVVWTTIPPTDAFFDVPLAGGRDFGALQLAWRRFLIGMVPIPPLDGSAAWNHSVFDTLGGTAAHLVPWFGLALLLLWLLALAKRPFLALPFLVGVLVMGTFQNFKYEGAIRHWGHFWLLLVACVWLSRKCSSETRDWSFQRGLFAINLLAQVAAGYLVLSTDMRETFSGARATASFLTGAGLADEPLVGAADHPVSGVASYLERDFHWPESGDTGQTVVFHNRRRSVSPAALLRAAYELSQSTQKSPVLVSSVPILRRSYRGMAVAELYVSPPAMAADEQFYVYRMEPGAATEPTQMEPEPDSPEPTGP